MDDSDISPSDESSKEALSNHGISEFWRFNRNSSGVKPPAIQPPTGPSSVPPNGAIADSLSLHLAQPLVNFYGVLLLLSQQSDSLPMELLGNPAFLNPSSSVSSSGHDDYQGADEDAGCQRPRYSRGCNEPELTYEGDNEATPTPAQLDIKHMESSTARPRMKSGDLGMITRPPSAAKESHQGSYNGTYGYRIDQPEISASNWSKKRKEAGRNDTHGQAAPAALRQVEEHGLNVGTGVAEITRDDEGILESHLSNNHQHNSQAGGHHSTWTAQLVAKKNRGSEFPRPGRWLRKPDGRVVKKGAKRRKEQNLNQC
ncbi:hypothetical protein C8R45DRAFT_929330 [Mycena sanguinolenta]|nr:hypothetical protein C8R45DRAFT_929330 [Mycena sanguinolenta]